mgnify:CR=1 FL=1
MTKKPITKMTDLEYLTHIRNASGWVVKTWIEIERRFGAERRAQLRHAAWRLDPNKWILDEIETELKAKQT